MNKNILLLTALLLGTGPAAQAADPKIEALARSCNSCHGLNGVSAGLSMPSIGGLPESYLYTVMLQWKHGERYSATMGRHFKGYSDDELAGLAKYFAALPWTPVEQPADGKTTSRAKDVTERCVGCHGATGAEPVDKDTPMLHGQWARYLELELMKYRTEGTDMPHKKMRKNAQRMGNDADAAAAARFYGAQSE
jgi:sulfide dehydrogenase cytochrome subunit